MLWGLCRLILIRFSPRPFHGWRAFIYRLWGAKLGRGCHIYPDARVWAPWNLECAEGACIGDRADVYNVALISLGAYAVISQDTFICSASHDFRDPNFPLTTNPIRIGSRAWVAARAIVLPGIEIGEGCVIGAGSVVTKSMPPWAVCAGNPCRVLRRDYRK